MDPSLLREARSKIKTDGAMGAADQLLYCRAMMPSLVPTTPQPPAQATFHWIKRPRADCPEGTTYMDGSLIHTQQKYGGLAGRNGWSVTTFSEQGTLLAASNGVPPAWAPGIHAAELWALLMAISIADFMNPLLTDCRSILDGASNGCEWAQAPESLLGRAWRPVTEGLEANPERLGWMPAHG